MVKKKIDTQKGNKHPRSVNIPVIAACYGSEGELQGVLNKYTGESQGIIHTHKCVAQWL